jgi:hypothetical protein
MNHSTASAPLAERFESRSETDTCLHGSWLMLVRLVFLTLSVLTVGLFVADIPSYLAKLHLLCTGAAELACQGGGQLTPGDVQRLHELGLSLDFYATYTIVITSIFALGYWLVAAFLFWRKSDDRVALLAAVSLALFPMVFNTPLINALPSPWLFLVLCIRFLGTQSLGLFIYLFPSGHFVPRWMRWVFVATLIYWGLNTFFPFASFNPFSFFTLLGSLILLGPIGTIVVVQIFRYRWVSSPAQRQQTKWVVYGISMGWGGYLVIFTLLDWLAWRLDRGPRRLWLHAACPAFYRPGDRAFQIVGDRSHNQPHISLWHPLRLRRRGICAGGGNPGRTHWHQWESGHRASSNRSGGRAVPTLARLGAAGSEPPALRST